MIEQQIGQMVDINAPAVVQVQIRADRKVLWVNIDGVCRLRCCLIGELTIVDDSLELACEQSTTD